ncbi:hypothetical protein [Paenibacillus albiflavus]|nr:hypothetical protein [Paenibacillus albiflavus]
MKNIQVKDPPKQPEKCKGCVEGRWEGVQYCWKQKCIKDGDTNK